MRIPIKVTSYKSRALAAEAERDALQRELTMADALEVTLRGQIDSLLERINDYHRRAVLAEAEARIATDSKVRLLTKIREWIDTPSSTVRRASRVALADHLGVAHPAATVEAAKDAAA